MVDSIRPSASSFQLDVDEWRAFFETRTSRHRRLVAGYLLYVAEMAEKGLPPIFEGRHLAQLLGLTGAQLFAFSSSPEDYYRSFSIPKRSGGERLVAAPQPLLLHCQRWIDAFVLRKLPVHGAAHGYVAGRSNISNARAHLGQREVLCIDIKDFFPSLHVGAVIQVFLSAGYPHNVAYLMAKLCSYSGALPQGGASSPCLSNVLMLGVDRQIEALAASRGLRYTRYVDDITLSGSKVGAVVDDISAILGTMSLQLNSKKMRLQRGQKKLVTGISIGSGTMKVPRAMRRRFKDQAFRAIKQLSDSALSPPDDPLLYDRQLGQLSYWASVEPENVSVAQTRAHLRDLLNQRLASIGSTSAASSGP